MTARLRTRAPSGVAAWPLVLVEGEEKAGKSWQALTLSASDRIGRTFVFDLGDGTADEYAALGDYEVVDLDGTYTDLVEQLTAAAAEPSEDGLPNLIVVDSLTHLWDTLKAWTDQRARSSRAGKKALAADPDAAIDPTMNLWNDAKSRFHRVLNLLRRFDGIAVVTAQGGEVAKVEGGQPVAGQTIWSIQAEKTTAASVTAWVRVRRGPRSVTLIGARSLHAEVPDRGLELPLDRALEHLVFDVLGAGGFGSVAVRDAVVGVPVTEAKRRALEAVRSRWPHLDDTAATDFTRRLWRDAGLPTSLADAVEVPPDSLADLLAVITADDTAGPDPRLDRSESDAEPVAGG